MTVGQEVDQSKLLTMVRSHWRGGVTVHQPILCLSCFSPHRFTSTPAANVPMVYRILSLLLGLLVAGPMSVPVRALARSETRVGGGAEFSSVLASPSASQVGQAHQESLGCAYDFASGVHKYLYCHDDPVNSIDPSGHESLITIQAAMGLVVQMHLMHELRGGNAALKGAQGLFGGDDVTVGLTFGADVLQAVEDSVAVASLAAGTIYGGYKLITWIGTGSTRLIKNLRRIPLAEANSGHSYPNPSGYGPPYRAGADPRQFTTAAPVEFVRVHGPFNQEGEWVVRAEEIAGMSAKQIREHLALKHAPTHISKVVVPAGKEMRFGYAAAQPEFAVSGGGVQYQILDRSGVLYSNMRPIK